jgi:hypothetical protein
MPGHANLAVRITGFEEVLELGVGFVVEALVADREQLPGSIERVVAMTGSSDFRRA